MTNVIAILQRRVPVTLVAALCLVVSGCGGGGDLEPVKGTVTVNGEPVGPGIVTFEPVSVSSGPRRVSFGRFDADGRYELVSDGHRSGAPPGEYFVRISSAGAGDEEVQQIDVGKIPPKYGHEKLSGLTATVKAGEDNVIDFDLQP